MIQKDFAGLNNFVWFTGVVADSQDKAQVGRIRVRIIGWHNENKNLQPDNELPWAQILLPVNNSRTLSLPKPGEWVFGFFQDGQHGQMPVVVGVYPRIQTKPVKTANTKTDDLATLQNKLADAQKQLVLLKQNAQTTTRQRLIAEKEKEIAALKASIASIKSKLNVPENDAYADPRTQQQVNNSPKPPTDVVEYVLDEPTFPRIGRGIMEMTLVNKTNNDRKHVCDITGQLAPVVLYLKTKYGIIATELREMVRKILKALGWDPSGESSALISFIKKVTNFLLEIVEMLEEVLDWKRLLVDVAAAAKAMIDYIMSLPEKLYNMFKKCLNSLYKQLYAAFKLITDLGNDKELSASDKELKEAWKQLEEVGKVLKDQTKELINSPQEFVDAVTKPASQDLLDEIDIIISTALPTDKSVTDSAGFDKTQQERP